MKSFLPCACLLIAAASVTANASAHSDTATALQRTSVSLSVAETLTTNTPRTTVDGNGFTAPAGWSIRTSGLAVILTAPEGDSHIALIDVAAKEADAAVAAAWAAYNANATWPLKMAGDRPVRDGWEQIRGYQYETSLNEQRVVSALARRRGERWTVMIRDVTTAVDSKRSSQIGLIAGSLLPKGYSRETFAGKTAHKFDSTRLAAMRQFVEAARLEFDVPGIAIGIVQDGKIILAEGFGVRELGKPEKVDANTMFMVASVTKPMTTLMLAKLVEAGKFTWDTPVKQVLPSFKLGDADTTKQVLMKHLVCACTGLPRQDMEWVFEGERLTPASVVAMLASMQPTSAFGELYQYSNLMAGTAGYIGGHALYPNMELGAAYDKAMQTLVFDPLGMTATTFDFERAQRGNHATPHGENNSGQTVPASMDISYTTIPSRPDGGAWSNIHDLLRYVQMELNNGLLPDGKRYIAEEPLLARRLQQVARGNDLGYGTGLKLDRTSGALVVHHGGSAFGGKTEMLWLPEHNVGAVILSNSDSNGIRGLIQRRFLEVLFDGNREAVINAPMLAKLLKDNAAAERKNLSMPADPAMVGKLATRYDSAELGSITVVKKGETTWFDFGGWKSEVATRHDDDGTLSFVTVSPSKSGYEFVVTDKDSRRALMLRDAQQEYVFTEAK